MSNFVVYKRLSKESKSGGNLGLDAQAAAIDEFLAKQVDPNVVGVYEEIETGTSKKVRPLFLQAIERCKQTNSVLLIAKLDRLARNVAVVANLMESRVQFIALDNANASPFTIHILAAVAEHEANMISDRVKAALKAAKVRGSVYCQKRERMTCLLGAKGATNLTAEAKALGRIEAFKKIKQNSLSFAEGLRPVIVDCLVNQLTLVDIAEHLTKLQIRTRQNKNKWYPSSVSNLIKTLKL